MADDDLPETPQSRGGKARADKLTPDKRKEIAAKAAQSRWKRGDDIRGAAKVVAFGDLSIGDAVIPCAVLEDGTRVLSERGMGKAIGRDRGGYAWAARATADGGAELPYFLTAKRLKPFIDNDLMLATYRPVFYHDPKAGGRVAHGVKAELIPRICSVWLQARRAGVLNKSHSHIADRAEILSNGLAHIGIISLVDEATGYQHVREKDELQKILAAYISAEFLPWSQRFPMEYYKEMFRLWNWPWPPKDQERGGPLGPRYAGKLTNKLVYDQLPAGVADALKDMSPTDEKWQRRERLHTGLTEEIGQPHLEKQVAVSTNLMKVCDDKEEFMRKFERAFPGAFPKARQLSLMPKLAPPASEKEN